MWGFYIGTIFKKPSVYTEYYTLQLISSYQIATPNRFVFNVDPFGSCAWSLFLSFARHLCVQSSFSRQGMTRRIFIRSLTPVRSFRHCTVLLYVPLYCTVELYLLYFVWFRSSDSQLRRIVDFLKYLLILCVVSCMTFGVLPHKSVVVSCFLY